MLQINGLKPETSAFAIFATSALREGIIGQPVPRARKSGALELLTKSRCASVKFGHPRLHERAHLHVLDNHRCVAPRRGGRLSADDTATLEKNAEAGDAEAQYQLGVRYEMGSGVPKDFSHAESWFAKSAAQNNPNGEMLLGTCYMSGLGVPLDMAKAREWFGKAAKQGNEQAVGMLAALGANAVESAPASGAESAPQPAQIAAAPVASADVNSVTTYQPEPVLIQRKDADDPKIARTIGYYLLEGISTKKNTDEAAKWIKLAADQGDPFALGLQAQYALGQPKDVAKALASYQVAITQGDDLAADHLGHLYFVGRGRR